MGLAIQGMAFRGQETIESIPGLVLDWNALSAIEGSPGGVTKVVNLPDNSGNENSIQADGSTTSNWQKHTGYIRGNGRLKSTSMSAALNVLTQQRAFGVYTVLYVESGSVNVFFPLRTLAGGATAYQLQVRSNDSNKIRVICANAATVTTATGIPFNTFVCVRHIVGPNNTGSNQKIYYNGSLLSTTTRNQTAPAATIQEVLMNNAAPSTDFARIKRTLVYDWTGKTQSEVNALDALVIGVIGQLYGITF